MSNRPPSPPSPLSPPTATSLPVDTSDENRVLATTPQLTTSIDDVLGYRPDEETLERILLELDRCSYVECVTITRTGDYVWDLSESPDRIADAIAEAVVASLHSWLRGYTAVEN